MKDGWLSIGVFWWACITLGAVGGVWLAVLT